MKVNAKYHSSFIPPVFDQSPQTFGQNNTIMLSCPKFIQNKNNSQSSVSCLDTSFVCFVLVFKSVIHPVSRYERPFVTGDFFSAAQRGFGTGKEAERPSKKSLFSRNAHIPTTTLTHPKCREMVGWLVEQPAVQMT